MFGIDQVS